MRAILKFYFDIAPIVAIARARGAIVRHVAMQYEGSSLHPKPEPSVWVEADDTAPTVTCRPFTLNTGEEVPSVPPSAHIGTLVFGKIKQYATHVYDGEEVPE